MFQVNSRTITEALRRDLERARSDATNDASKITKDLYVRTFQDLAALLREILTYSKKEENNGEVGNRSQSLASDGETERSGNGIDRDHERQQVPGRVEQEQEHAAGKERPDPRSQLSTDGRKRH